MTNQTKGAHKKQTEGSCKYGRWGRRCRLCCSHSNVKRSVQHINSPLSICLSLSAVVPTKLTAIKSRKTRVVFLFVSAPPALPELTIWICKCATNEHFKMSPGYCPSAASLFFSLSRRIPVAAASHKKWEKIYKKSKPARAQSAVLQVCKQMRISQGATISPSRVLQPTLSFLCSLKREKRCLQLL